MIEDLLYRYGELIDSGDLEGVAYMFEHGRITTSDGSTIARGRDEVLALYESATRIHDDGTPRTRHLTTNVVVEVDEDAGTATSRSYFTVLQQVEDGPLQPIIAGSYRDRFERVEAGWHFVERSMAPDLIGDLSHHLLFDRAALDELGAPGDLAPGSR